MFVSLISEPSTKDLVSIDTSTGALTISSDENGGVTLYTAIDQYGQIEYVDQSTIDDDPADYTELLSCTIDAGSIECSPPGGPYGTFDIVYGSTVHWDPYNAGGDFQAVFQDGNIGNV